ncbi:uncharacterized protein L969DRAFT_85849 [Mixia osmundae IAM 14324]|uniref:NAD-dependent epimerase/dehydratase domain-containing protein n=1 Tax=Mixia osmundae (strain CBS 9802 / IAM 14324 / JCM 22182 / KY 12970) TaxID=764103 RepID=G7E5V2_MIXOS|nr:uncharacterized protein L969DRAFT_85849 [Mixia osmundae IAM 14324]KEI40636.1 hypothetical protein L969DRAFT_85849 [Mixia osmundae IAM 14324]GAA98212.1 hypothetical protein E5Q_04895 [Mixia osmundae IAM 14324]
MSSQRLAPGSLILVTGATGFIGSSVAEHLVRQGFHVRGVTRSASRAQALKSKLDKEHGAGSFETVEIHDITQANAFDEAIKGVDGVLHLATDSSLSDDAATVVKSVVDGTLSLARAAAKTPSVKSFVLTSSRIASFNPESGKTYRPDMNIYFEEAVTRAFAKGDDPLRGVYAYAASKVEGEKAFWKFVDAEKPAYSANAVLPDYVLGRVSNPEKGKYSTHTFLNDILEGKPEMALAFNAVPSWYVDVEDAARVHIAALLEPDVNHERLWAAAGPFSLDEALDAWRHAWPKANVPQDFKGLPEPAKVLINNTRSTELLKRQGRAGWVSFKDAAVSNARELFV